MAIRLVVPEARGEKDTNIGSKKNNVKRSKNKNINMKEGGGQKQEEKHEGNKERGASTVREGRGVEGQRERKRGKSSKAQGSPRGGKRRISRAQDDGHATPETLRKT